jgi:hypothetical protein
VFNPAIRDSHLIRPVILFTGHFIDGLSGLVNLFSELVLLIECFANAYNLQLLQFGCDVSTEPDFKLQDKFSPFETASLEVCILIKYFIHFSGYMVAMTVCTALVKIARQARALIAQSASSWGTKLPIFSFYTSYGALDYCVRTFFILMNRLIGSKGASCGGS